MSPISIPSARDIYAAHGEMVRKMILGEPVTAASVRLPEQDERPLG